MEAVISDPAPCYAGTPLPLSTLLPVNTAKDSPALVKYWSQRYRLFSKFDDGVCLDHGEHKATYAVGLLVVLYTRIILEW